MRICYVQLSPTFGMHQYASDLANRMAQAGHDVHLVTTTRVPADRYLSSVKVQTPVTLSNTGFSRESLGVHNLRRVYSVIKDLNADVVHFTGPHLWNAVLVKALVRKGVGVVHTLHDLDPHLGTRHGFLLRIWNQRILRWSKHILVHGEIYRERLLSQGFSPERVTFTPVLHLFLSPGYLNLLSTQLATSIQYQSWALFFGRVERYKGADHLLTAGAMMKNADGGQTQIVLAGPGDLSTVWAGPLPPNVEVRNRLIPDDEAIDLFRRCGFVVLPYIDATQSALVGAAYYFRKPVVVTRTGALPEYVEDDQTGRIVEPGHPASLARCLEDMLSDPIRLAQMGAAGRIWYDAYREIEMTTLLEMYRGVAQGQPASSEHKVTLSPTALKQN
jgi:glycosyltransferase involved in cell wall biosynthesis